MEGVRCSDFDETWHVRRRCKECHKLYQRAWRKTPKGVYNRIKRDVLLKGTKQEGAKKAVYKAVRDGRLKPIKSMICIDCAAPAECYDHRDYLKPLEVEPVCVSCNLKRGPGLNAI